jgi:hypothetical protein
MSFVPTNYLTAEHALDEIGTLATQHFNRMDRGIALLVEARDELQRMSSAAPLGWIEAVQYIDAQATANPGDVQWQTLKARKDKLVADFTAMRTRANNVLTAAQTARGA